MSRFKNKKEKKQKAMKLHLTAVDKVEDVLHSKFDKRQFKQEMFRLGIWFGNLSHIQGYK